MFLRHFALISPNNCIKSFAIRPQKRRKYRKGAVEANTEVNMIIPKT